MKTSIKTLLVFVGVYVITAASSFAQLIYTFDEFGNSSGPSSAPPISPGVLQPDPSGGVSGPVLVYTVPLPMVTGDVVLTEPGNPATGGQNSDIVRFWNPTGVNLTQIIFYSDVLATDPADAPADTGLPAQLISPIFIPELGPEGNNGATYTPPAGAPGSTLGGVVIQYNIISDVPEPGTMTLAILAGAALLLAMKRRQTTN